MGESALFFLVLFSVERLTPGGAGTHAASSKRPQGVFLQPRRAAGREGRARTPPHPRLCHLEEIININTPAKRPHWQCAGLAAAQMALPVCGATTERMASLLTPPAKEDTGGGC